MRYLVYLLVLANAVFFLWEIGGRGGKDSDASYQELRIPSGVERIALASEVAGLSLAEPVTVAAAAGEAAPPQNAGQVEPVPPLPEPKPAPKKVDCFRIGPSQTRAEADGFLELLKSHAPKARVDAKPGDVPDGWWVLFPKAVSLEAGKENRKMLADKGILDTWLFDKGPLQGAISLGLYKTKEQAEAARKPFMDKNIMTEVAPRMVRGEVYWVIVPWQRPALEFEEIVQVLNTQDPSLHIPAPVPCD
jgi:hypothetical protein